MTCFTVSAGVRRAPISIVSGLCIAHWMSVSICGGMVAENSAVWRWRGHLFDDAAHVGQKAHVEHPVGLVEHEELHLVEPHRALFEMIQQTSGRGDDDVRARRAIRPSAGRNRRRHKRRWFSNW